MRRFTNYFFFGFLLLIVIYHLFTLEIQPLPWFDEVFFASVTESLLSNGDFIPSVSSYATNQRPSLLYGPVYFLLTGFSIKVFGFGIFQFRIIALLSGLFCVRLTYLIAKRYIPSEPWKYMILIGGILTDPFFTLAFHQGRMDLTALAFCLASIYFFLRSDYKSILMSGSMGVLAVFTTPRSAVILLPMVIILVIRIFGQRHKLKDALFWSLPFLVLYPIWIFVGFGGFTNYLDYYLSATNIVYSANAGYIGSNFYIPRHEYILISVSLLAFIYGIIKEKKAYFNSLILICIGSISLFYILVTDWGPYSTFIIPFYYLIILNSWSFISGSINKQLLFSLPLAILMIFNVSYTAVKGIQVVNDRTLRDPKIAEDFIKENIPAGSKVIGDATYYYAVRKAGSAFQLFDQFDSLSSREKKLRIHFAYEYLAVADVMKPVNSYITDYFIKQGNLEKVAIFRSKGVEQSSGLLSNLEAAGYSGAIYRRK